MSETSVNVARFIGLPLLFMGVAFVTSTFTAVVGSTFHVLLAGSDISVVGNGVNLTVSICLGATLLAGFWLSGAVLVLAKSIQTYQRRHRTA